MKNMLKETLIYSNQQESILLTSPIYNEFSHSSGAAARSPLKTCKEAHAHRGDAVASLAHRVRDGQFSGRSEPRFAGELSSAFPKLLRLHSLTAFPRPQAPPLSAGPGPPPPSESPGAATF